MSRLTLARELDVRELDVVVGNIRYVTNRKKTFLTLALLYVIDSGDLHFGRTFSIFNRFSKVLLHILGQSKCQILQRQYFAYITSTSLISNL